MNALPAQKPAEYADLFDLPKNLIGEIINGRIVTQPRPAPRHVLASSNIGLELGSPFQKGKDGPGGWWILDEPELHLGRHVFVPDLAGWRRERLPRLPDTAWFELAPDWICEILSPSTARTDRAEKLPIYAKEGVSHVWLVDPDARTLEIFANENNRWTLLAVLQNDDPVSQPPFDAITFPLNALWAD